MTGLLLVDKPSGMTSHDVVDRIRKAARIRRVGHTGTLDPSATGLLVLCLGQATRLSEHLTGLDKVYEGTMRLGVVTATYDMDGEVVEENAVPGAITREDVTAACERFTGAIEQVPPMVSAVRVGGERLYKKARKGEVVDRPPRLVTVRAFDVLDFSPPDVRVRVVCTSGTYVRSLCHDVGALLGCGAALAELRRMAVGAHRVEEAQVLDALDSPEKVDEALVPMADALDLPEVVVRESRRYIVETGGALGNPDLREPCPAREGWVQVKSESGDLLALGQVEPSAAGARVHPKRVFAQS